MDMRPGGTRPTRSHVLLPHRAVLLLTRRVEHVEQRDLVIDDALFAVRVLWDDESAGSVSSARSETRQVVQTDLRNDGGSSPIVGSYLPETQPSANAITGVSWIPRPRWRLKMRRGRTTRSLVNELRRTMCQR